MYILTKVSDILHSVFSSYKEKVLPWFEQLLQLIVQLIVSPRPFCENPLLLRNQTDPSVLLVLRVPAGRGPTGSGGCASSTTWWSTAAPPPSSTPSTSCGRCCSRCATRAPRCGRRRPMASASWLSSAETTTVLSAQVDVALCRFAPLGGAPPHLLGFLFQRRSPC